MNTCDFSPCEKYRYTLFHKWDELVPVRRTLMGIGLNPSTANNEKLDPTLTRWKGFAIAWGFNQIVVLNAFAFRATKPADMKRQADPVGPLNDAFLNSWAACADKIVCWWGTHASHRNRAAAVKELLAGHELFCLGRNADGSPKHPLYLSADTRLEPFQCSETKTKNSHA